MGEILFNSHRINLIASLIKYIKLLITNIIIAVGIMLINNKIPIMANLISKVSTATSLPLTFPFRCSTF
jgi:hypothetical protein